MRIFVAAELPQKTKENLARSAEQMKHFAEKGNFVPMQNYHITLHFLGEVAETGPDLRAERHGRNTQ